MKRRTTSMASVMLAAYMLGTSMEFIDGKGHKKTQETVERPKGYVKPPKTEEKKTAHKEHQKKLKQKRNAKKGIHEIKFKYKRGH